MKIRLAFLVVIVLHGVLGTAQKPALDTAVLGRWPSIEQVGISANGHCYYSILDEPKYGRRMLFLSTDTKREPYRSEIKSGCQFSANSKWGVFINTGDSLAVVDMVSFDIRYFPGVRAFQVSESAEVGALVLEKDEGFSIYTFSNHQMLTISRAGPCLFQPGGGAIVFTRKLEKGDSVEVGWLDIRTERQSVLWTGFEASGLTFDKTGDQLAFVGKEVMRGGSDIYYVGRDRSRAVPWVFPGGGGMRAGLSVSDDDVLQFSRDGRTLLFSVKGPKPAIQKRMGALGSVDVWSYKDLYLQSEQMSSPAHYAEMLNPTVFLATVRVGSDSIVRLQWPGEYVDVREEFGDHLLVVHDREPDDTVGFEKRWLSLRSVETGKTERLTSKDRIATWSVSPEGRFALWFDSDSLLFWCYDVRTGRKTCISAMVPESLYDTASVRLGRLGAPFGAPAWVEGDRRLLVYDQYDIWEVDPLGKQPAVCLTNHEGRSGKIVLGLVNTAAPDGLTAENRVFVVREKIPWLLAGYSPLTKENGFWFLSDLAGHQLRKKAWGPYCYYIPRIGMSGYVEYLKYAQFPVKATGANAYLVAKMSEKDFPDWYLTRDFVSFRPLTDLHPEVKYNWLRTELVRWTMTDGRISQGILYRPEDFDSTRKYPLIFEYYEKRSDQLHQYLMPDWSESRINIPYFVSNGYLVFVPDIYFHQGYNGEGVCNAVLSAARYFSRFAWVDSTKLGLQGHSFAGWATNYLITRTTLFRAACEVAGVSDAVSGYDELSFRTGSARQVIYEVLGQGSPYGVGVSPWTDPDAYIRNSPIFYAGKVSTPLLMMQGDADAAVPFSQSLEWFLALRRAGKKVWFLQYEKEGHVLSKPADARDFTIRLRQFFDYYLKGALPPKWMTKGVPDYLKGIDPCLDLDESKAIP